MLWYDGISLVKFHYHRTSFKCFSQILALILLQIVIQAEAFMFSAGNLYSEVHSIDSNVIGKIKSKLTVQTVDTMIKSDSSISINIAIA